MTMLTSLEKLKKANKVEYHKHPGGSFGGMDRLYIPNEDMILVGGVAISNKAVTSRLRSIDNSEKWFHISSSDYDLLKKIYTSLNLNIGKTLEEILTEDIIDIDDQLSTESSTATT